VSTPHQLEEQRMSQAYASAFNSDEGRLVVDDLAAFVQRLEPQDRAGAALMLTRIMLRGRRREPAQVRSGNEREEK
jgi:hypothetical protein